MEVPLKQVKKHQVQQLVEQEVQVELVQQLQFQQLQQVTLEVEVVEFTRMGVELDQDQLEELPQQDKVVHQDQMLINQEHQHQPIQVVVVEDLVEMVLPLVQVVLEVQV